MEQNKKNKNSQPEVYILVEEEESEQINCVVYQKVINTSEQTGAGKGQRWVGLVDGGDGFDFR